MRSQLDQVIGVIILGGRGTRLHPLTSSVNKHFLAVYDKPMFHYPLSVLLLAGCREIAVVSNKNDRPHFEKAIKELELNEVNFTFYEQFNPQGIVDALESAREFIENREFWLALGDNLLFGPGLGRNLGPLRSRGKCHVFSTTSREPERFGSIKLNDLGHPVEIREKADKSFSNQVLTGLYLFPAHTMDLVTEVKESSRGEREVTDLIGIFLNRRELTLTKLPLGTTWIDLGTFDDLHDASTLIRLHQSHSGAKLGDPRGALSASISVETIHLGNA